jgi:hypothetical protein
MGGGMTKLHEAPWDGDTKGWQWEDGPIFLGPDARKYAVDYGKALLRQDDLKIIAKLQHEGHFARKRLAALEKIRNEK